MEWTIKNRRSFKIKREGKQHYWIRSPPWAKLAEVNSAAAAPQQRDYSMCCQAMQQFSRSFHFLGQPRILSCRDAEWFKRQKPKQWVLEMEPNIHKVPWLADVFEKGRRHLAIFIKVRGQESLVVESGAPDSWWCPYNFPTSSQWSLRSC